MSIRWTSKTELITSRSVSPQAIAASEQTLPTLLYQILFEQARDMTFVVRANGQIITANQAAIQGYGYELPELLKLTISDLVDPQSQTPLAEPIGSSSEVDDVLFETIHRRKDGSTFPVEVNLRTLVVSNERLLWQSVRDVSDRKRLEAKLEESELKSQAIAEATTVQAKQFSEALKRLQETQAQLIQTEKMSSLGQLVAGIAHEINNPVNFIYGNLFHVSDYTHELLELVSLYQQHYPQPKVEIKDQIEAIDLEFLTEDLLKILSSMKIGVDRIRQIVLSLRNFSRLDEAEMKPVDIHEGLDNTILILNHKIKKEIEITKQYQQLPLIECYPAQLNQVFMNILSNAIDALNSIDQPFKEITVSTEALSNNQIKVTISDNGPGIPSSVIHKLFDPFFTTKPVGQGTGLGLAICYQIIEKHQGKIEVVSEVGKGTSFLIFLPRNSYV